MQTIGSVVLAIVILLAMITVHEFGHYVAGKALKFKINEFSIGFGPKLFKRTSKRTGEIFAVRVFPLGGYCAFEGEDSDEQSEDAFNNKAPWKRIIVLVAGATFNYLLALLLIIISMFSFGQMLIAVDEVHPALEEKYVEYSLKEGDIIKEINGEGIYLVSDFAVALNKKSEGDIVKAKVLRGGGEVEVEIMLRGDCNFKNSSDVTPAWKALGLKALHAENVKMGFFTTIGHSFVYSGKIAGTIFRVLGELLTGRLSLSAMGGPVTTIKLTSQIASQGFQDFLEIAAYIGVNLAVFNLLPIPALDGSKVVFCLIEWIFRKPVPRKIEAVIHAVGFVALLLFAVLVDILQFV